MSLEERDRWQSSYITANSEGPRSTPQLWVPDYQPTGDQTMHSTVQDI